jgi:hypothetical protein
LVLSIAASLPALGQTFGEITGEVRDASGALVPGVAVTATNVATNAQRSTASNDAGVYSFPSLPPGSYSVRAEKSGFKVHTAKVEVQVQQTVRLDLEMAVGSVSETVEVSGSVQLLTTENATIGTVVENKRIVESWSCLSTGATISNWCRWRRTPPPVSPARVRRGRGKAVSVQKTASR